MTPVAELKRAQRATWAAGDYAAVAERIDEAPPRDLLARATVAPGEDVLDVATGTGNLAIPAAAGGARVVGLDLTPVLLEAGRRRAEQVGVTVEWIEGDAEALPFDDEAFDHVLSVFGVQFAPRHEVAAGELARVCRTGGQIGLVSWTPDGAIGELLSIIGRYLPPPPAYASPPSLWGSEDHLRGLFDRRAVALRFTRGLNAWRFDSAEQFVAFMETHYGPMLKARERLGADGHWEACRREILAMVERRNEATDDTLLLNAAYLVAVGRKAVAGSDWCTSFESRSCSAPPPTCARQAVTTRSSWRRWPSGIRTAPTPSAASRSAFAPARCSDEGAGAEWSAARGHSRQPDRVRAARHA